MIAFGQFLEVLIGGLLSGVLYSLVALGFRADFQGVRRFQLCARRDGVAGRPLSLVRSLDFLAAARGFPGWAAIVLGLAFAALIMTISAYLIERLVLGPLVESGMSDSSMSTIGVTFILEGISQMIFGAEF